MYKKVVLGNFDDLAHLYKNSRPGYSDDIIRLLKIITRNISGGVRSLDLGCGTGIFTREISKISDQVLAIDLSYEMIRHAYKLNNVKYINTSIENLNSKKKFNLITAASSFHWFDNIKLSDLINKSLKKNGYFLICYNSRDINQNLFLKKVEKKIQLLSQSFRSRVSSGQSNFVEKKINSFSKISKLKNCFKIDFHHEEKFTKKRYFSVWKSSNEFRNKLNPQQQLNFFEFLHKNFPGHYIKVKYINKCWIFQNQNL